MAGDAVYEGGCLCGAVRWRATGEPRHRAVCHCTSCRRATGSNGVPWATFTTDAFTFSGAQPKRYASSPPVTRTFCGECGTPLTYEHAKRPGEIDVTLGSLDDPSAIAPDRRIWLEDAAPWEAHAHELPSHRRWSSPG